MNNYFYFKVFKQLVYSQLVVFKQLLLDKAIDLAIWVVLTVGVMAYIMPYFGLSAEFGAFQLGGILAAVGLFEVFGSAFELVADFEGDRAIDYALTLPIPSWLVLLSKVAYYSIAFCILTFCMLPVGKLTIWNQLDVFKVSYVKLILATIVASIFYGCFVLWTASIVSGITRMNAVWARYIFPMWFMGGFQFSWLSLLATVPLVAYISLLNPMIYVTESFRSALLNPHDYINFWLCVGAITLFSVISFARGYYNLKRRLDFV